MNILAIEAATEACSAALMIDAEVLERFEIAPRRHAELLLPMLDGLLAEAGLTRGQVDALAFGRGPGAFTGVRIATGVAQGVALGLDVPVAPISTLRALAQGVYRVHGANRVLTALDARMDEVYWGAYTSRDDGLMHGVGDECVCPPEAVTAPDGADWAAAGHGWASYGDQLTAVLALPAGRRYGDFLPHARDVATLGLALLSTGQGVDAEAALPVYLRDRVTR